MASKLRQRLIEAREAADLTQTQLAKQLGRTQSFVSNYERGQRRLDVPEFIEIAQGLGLDPTALVAELAGESSPALKGSGLLATTKQVPNR
jgi:transcriptional regulator with XRE-family HTH domain